jgi:hypothetical protein
MRNDTTSASRKRVREALHNRLAIAGRIYRTYFDVSCNPRRQRIKSLTQRLIWKALAALHKKIHKLHLRKLFADDPKRGEKTTRARSSSRRKKIIKIYPLRFAFWPVCEFTDFGQTLG